MTTNGVRMVSVAAAPGISLSNAFTVGAGLQVPTIATLGATEHGGVTVTITSSAPELVLVSPNADTPGSTSIPVTLANGLTSVPFVIQGVENVDATAIVTVSAPGFISDTATVKVTPSAIDIQSLPASVDAALGEVVNLYVQVGIPNATNTGLTAGQNVRAGSPGFLVTLTNSNSAVAELKSDEPLAIGQTVTKAIQSGDYYTHAVVSGTSFGLAFRPLAPGTTTVTATGPAGVITTNPGANRGVTVTGVPTIVTIAATDSDAREAGANTGTFTITRSAATAQSLTVNYARTGTAIAGADYITFSATAVIIPANQTSVTVTVTPVADLSVEGPETVTLTLLDATAYDLGAPATRTATVTIADDPTIVTIVATDPDATEAGPTTGTFTISRVGGAIAQPLSVSYVRTTTAPDTATAGTDYVSFSATTVSIPANQTSVTITVTPIRDLLVETPETVTLTLVDAGLTNAGPYDLGGPGTDTATVTIADDPTIVSIVESDPSATEAGPTTGTFTISRIGGATAQGLTVTYVRTGTATAGTDYSQFSATTVTIPANQTSVTITVTPINDAIAEGPETVILTLTATASYNLSTQTTATVTIVSDE